MTIFAWLPKLWLVVAAPSSAEANDAPAMPIAPAAAAAAAAIAVVLIFKMAHSFFFFNRLSVAASLRRIAANTGTLCRFCGA
nr:hypothetical protein [Mycobacterium kyorinense]